MKDKRPLLSFCIPTYNRSWYLRKALEAYVNNPAFDDEVEIVISDNASTDETEAIGMDYSSRYSNIKYYRNDHNLYDSNFCIALERASGEYIKMMNDNVIISETGIQDIKNVLKSHVLHRPVIFFTNGYLFNHKLVPECYCENFDDFIARLSYVVTAIMVFGAWREQWSVIKDKLKYTRLKLNQDDWAYQLMEIYGNCYLCTCRYADSLQLKQGLRKGYNWFEVHIDNYYTIMQPYIIKGLISRKALMKDKKLTLLRSRSSLTNHYLYKVNKDWQFDTSGAMGYLWKNYKEVPLFYIFVATFPIWGPLKVIRNIWLGNKKIYK